MGLEGPVVDVRAVQRTVRTDPETLVVPHTCDVLRPVLALFGLAVETLFLQCGSGLPRGWKRFGLNLIDIADQVPTLQNESIANLLYVDAVNNLLENVVSGGQGAQVPAGEVREQRLVYQRRGVSDDLVPRITVGGCVEQHLGQGIGARVSHGEHAGRLIVIVGRSGTPQIALGGYRLVSHVVATPAVVHQALT